MAESASTARAVRVLVFMRVIQRLFSDNTPRSEPRLLAPGWRAGAGLRHVGAVVILGAVGQGLRVFFTARHRRRLTGIDARRITMVPTTLVGVGQVSHVLVVLRV